MLANISDLAERNRYETAARLRDHAAAAIDVLWRGQRLRALASVTEMVAARPDGDGGWHLAVVRHGQLAAAGNARRGVPPMPVVDAICAGAQAILPTSAPLGGALVEETALIARWLAQPGVRIVQGRTRLRVADRVRRPPCGVGRLGALGTGGGRTGCGQRRRFRPSA